MVADVSGAPAAPPVLSRRGGALIVVLTAVSGAVDAVGVVSLGGAFTSVMTGNMVLSGIGAARGETAQLATPVGAIVCYLLGCVLGSRVRGPAPRTGTPDAPAAASVRGAWPGVVHRILQCEALVLAASAVGWWLTGGDRGHGVQLTLLFANAVALGMQSAAIQRIGVSGLSTTYLTGTLTVTAISLAGGRANRHAVRPLLQLAALIAGGTLGCLLALHAPDLVPVPPLAGLALVAALAPGRPARWPGRRPAG